MDEFPEPLDNETDDEYRERLRTWFDAISEGDKLDDSAWEYICSLVGIDPD